MIMYILAFDLFRKDNKYIFKAIYLCCVEEISAFNYLFFVSSETNLMIIYLCMYILCG